MFVGFLAALLHIFQRVEQVASLLLFQWRIDITCKYCTYLFVGIFRMVSCPNYQFCLWHVKGLYVIIYISSLHQRKLFSREIVLGYVKWLVLTRVDEETGAAELGTMFSKLWSNILRSSDINALPSLLHRFAFEYITTNQPYFVFGFSN